MGKKKGDLFQFVHTRSESQNDNNRMAIILFFKLL